SADHRDRAKRKRPHSLQPGTYRAGQTRARRHPRRGRHPHGIPYTPHLRELQAAHCGAGSQSRLPWAGGDSLRLSPGRRRAHHRLRFFFQAEDGIRDFHVTGVQTCALPISKMDQKKFFTYSAIGAVLWTASMTLLGYFLGNIPWIKNNLEAMAIAIVVISVIPIVVEYVKGRRAKARDAA